MKNRTVGIVIATFAVLALIVGCGGGGTGGGGTTATNGGTTAGNTTGTFPGAGQFLEFRTNGNVPVDPLNLSVGDFITVSIVNYDPQGNRTVIPATSLQVLGAGASSYSLSAGVLRVLSQPTELATVRASGLVSGQSKVFNQDILVSDNLNTTVRGRILATDGTTGIAFLQVEFYDAGGNFVGGSVTDSTGRFSGKTAATARILSIKESTIPLAYYKAARYRGINYAISGLTCPLPLPTLTAGGTTSMPESIFIARQLDGPPPPPDGCKG